MVEIKPFKGTRPYNEDARNLIAPSTDHLSIENIEIFKKNNYWNYLKILNPVGQLKDCLLYTSPSPRDPVSSRMPSSA